MDMRRPPSGSDMIDIEAARRYHKAREARRYATREAERTAWLALVRVAVARIAPRHPDLRQVYLFGSLMQPGRFGPDSDLDVAVVCETVEAESAFWSALEKVLGRAVDVRPLVEPLTGTVQETGELVYERKDADPQSKHPQGHL